MVIALIVKFTGVGLLIENVTPCALAGTKVDIVTGMNEGVQTKFPADEVGGGIGDESATEVVANFVLSATDVAFTTEAPVIVAVVVNSPVFETVPCEVDQLTAVFVVPDNAAAHCELLPASIAVGVQLTLMVIRGGPVVGSNQSGPPNPDFPSTSILTCS